MSEPGQALWDAIVAVGGVPAPDFHQLHPGNQRVWRTVERTTANDALRRAAEVAEDYADHYLGGSEGLAAAIRARIGEGGE